MAIYKTQELAVLSTQTSAKLFIGTVSPYELSPDIWPAIFLPPTKYPVSRTSSSLWIQTLKQVAITGSRLEVQPHIQDELHTSEVEELNPDAHSLLPGDKLLIENMWQGEQKRVVLKVE